MAEPQVAEQFDDLAQQRQAASLGMWIFLATEVLFFGALIAGYLVYRVLYPDTFGAASQQLDRIIGGVNTAILLTSSLTMALADHAAEHGAWRRLRLHLGFTAGLGILFLAIKGYEWHHEFVKNLAPIRGQPFVFAEGHPEHAEMFYNLYFSLTGLHALHLLIGVSIVLVLFIASWRTKALLTAKIRITGLYWHFVDVVWVFLYPLLYLIK